MESDKDIKTWDQRLTDQSVRHWENYIHRRIDLSKARLDEIFCIPGEFIYVEDASDDDVAVAKIKIQKNNNDALDLENGVEIKTVFTQFFITNDALQDEWLDLIIGINFIYKKKIGDGFVNPIVTAAGVDLVLHPGAGASTHIGDAGAPGLAVNNDDLYVSGILEVDGSAYMQGTLSAYNIFCETLYTILKRCSNGGHLRFRDINEELTIPIGQGALGVVTAANLAPENSTIIGLVCRVTQAPGGGATTIDIGRTGGGNLDEFIDGIATALGTTGTFAANHDAATLGPVLNAANDTLTLTTDANVTIADMKVRIGVFYNQETPQTS